MFRVDNTPNWLDNNIPNQADWTKPVEKVEITPEMQKEIYKLNEINNKIKDKNTINHEINILNQEINKLKQEKPMKLIVKLGILWATCLAITFCMGAVTDLIINGVGILICLTFSSEMPENLIMITDESILGGIVIAVFLSIILSGLHKATLNRWYAKQHNKINNLQFKINSLKEEYNKILEEITKVIPWESTFDIDTLRTMILTGEAVTIEEAIMKLKIIRNNTI